MNTSYKLFFSLFFLVANLLACRTKMDIDLPESKKHAVVNSLITAGKPIFVELSESQGVFSRKPFAPIQEAHIKLYEDAQFVEELQHTDTGYVSVATPRFGHTYRLEISNEDFSDVSTETVLLPPLSILSVDTMTVSDESVYTDYGESAEYGKKMQFKLKIKDRGREAEYFFVSVCAQNPIYRIDTLTGKYTFKGFGGAYKSLPSDSDDPIFMNDNSYSFLEGFEGFVLNDHLFNKGEYNLEISVNFDNHYNRGGGSPFGMEELPDSIPVRIKFFSICEDLYKYIISYNKAEETEFNPFSQPVKVFSNVQNGLGIFSGYSVTDYDLILRRK